MRRRALAIAAAVGLLSPAAAQGDAATQAIGAVGAGVIAGVCGFIATGREVYAEEEGEEESEETRAADLGRSGWHLGSAGAVAVEDFDDPGGVRADDETLGFRVHLGYRCSPHLGAEAEFEWVEGFDRSDGSEADVWTLQSVAKWYPFTSRVQPFLLAGVGVLKGDVIPDGTKADIAVRFGAGLDFYLTDHVALTVDGSYVLPTANVKDLRYVSVGWGVLYRF